ncbi:Phage repressor protein C, contains Cro/C1-type HTH and peptisase s24 domains [Desulfonatronum thiosulfatophilum]|uniref:Phage repressor protein C, contains Cro/C1-type HTH and peptisase s24 domains n=1 Tax=Desulfonatronum thiosulfatophilum TaxID=617002 RepID=A0A1G6A329_9BACT|nr:S24 family peptidase [Desulfonatronum thiosulfatophilum]SDB02851.1 Phage repressor protein C, contains Cro/C1-type HTH and peptisase s24 domains [Desulfonatronum thiosulfatophilum]
MNFDDFFHRLSRVTDISSQKELATLLGVDPSAITMAKKRGVPKNWALIVATMFGLNPEWLKTGTGPIRPLNRDRTLFIPKVSARASAGAGSLETMDNVVGEIPFDRGWISMKGNPNRMVAMDVVGDSMSPELEAGDTILVDQSRSEVQSNAVYVIGLQDAVLVKRIQAHPGLVILYSANPRYAPVTLQGDEIETLRIIGRVLWSSREYA